MQLVQPEKIRRAGYQSKHQTTERRPASPSASRSLAKTIARTIANIARPKEIGKSSRQDSTGNYAREAV
jgi:plasmid stabilization system protein ParE